jgi:hypothetical protein
MIRAMQLPYLPLIVTAGGVLVLLMLALYRRRQGQFRDELGSVSRQWIAHHRTGPSDH